MNEKLMTRDEVLDSVQSLQVETKVKAWKMKVDDKYFHICAYHAYEIPPQVSIWPSNAAGSRQSDLAIFERPGRNHINCINEFLDQLN